jgi:phosphate transport system protein
MLRKTFDESLQSLQDEVLVLASMVQEMVTASAQALADRNVDRAERLIEQDTNVNRKRFQIEAGLLTLIATQGPIARDLRHVAALLEIITELERIGDYGKGIAKIVLMLGEPEFEAPMPTLQTMALRATEMLREALDSFIQQDVPAAREIAARDDEVDALYNRAYEQLLDLIIEDPSRIEQANQYLWAAHNLERVADRVTNICERTIFTVTGEMRELDTLDDEAGVAGIRG